MSELFYTNSARNCIVGCQGWQHDAWSGSYYPDDLPEDWRLDYYANDYNGALLSPEMLTEELFEQELPEDFCICLLQQQHDKAALTQQAQTLGDQFFAILADNKQIQDVSGVILGDWRYSSEDRSDCHCLVIDDLEQQNLKSLRQQLDSLIALPNGLRLIFCQHGKGDIETLNNVQTMTELMGLA